MVGDVTHTTTTWFGHGIDNYTLTRPLNEDDGRLGTIDVFARLITPPGGKDLPIVIKLQGGPGFACPRPSVASGWLKALLSRYRVLLIDQRGTGNSTPFDAASPHVSDCAPDVLADKLACLRADAIVRDCEAFRELLGIKTVSLFGQSYGGFCATTYVSMFPDSVDKVMLTGGLPATTVGIDDVYRRTYAAIAARSRELYERFDGVETSIRRVADHLANEEEVLPDGSVLTPTRMRMVGINLGRTRGLFTLAYAFEKPFHQTRDGLRLTETFKRFVFDQVSFCAHPLYAALHETIYAGTVAGATNWSAWRLSHEIEGFAPDADPTDSSEPYYLYGEHIFPSLFAEDPSLVPFAAAADILAARTDFGCLYDKDNLRAARVTGAAEVYLDDVFVPCELSMRTARTYADMRPVVTNQLHHDGISVDGEAIVRHLMRVIDDHAGAAG